MTEAQAPARTAAQSALVRFCGGAIAAALAVAIGVLAAWPVYRSAWLWVVALAAVAVGIGVCLMQRRWRLASPALVALLLGVFVLTVVPVAVPDSLASGDPLRGLLDGLAAVALGWKQLLTLTLPVGTYRTVLVPAYVVFLAAAVLVPLLARRGPRLAALAAIPMLAPVAFGTVFGSSEVSAPLRVGPLTFAAPREISLWVAAVALAAIWVAWVSGADRRAALRLGRATGSTARGGAAPRAIVGTGIVVVALVAGTGLVPVLDTGERDVPRDRIDPELVVRDRPSPLADYRSSKRDDALDTVLFSVSSDGALPGRLGLAVLDAYDGVDFHVGDEVAGRFTRFPSGERLESPSSITVRIGEGYADIWAPTTKLGAPPSFTGPRASDLSNSFYVNRDTGGAIAIPGDSEARPGFETGDGYTAPMETGSVPGIDRLGVPGARDIDLETVPELARWLERQGQPADADGFAELVKRLRDRGYLSHSLSDGEGERLWLERLGEQYGTVFEASAGGHSLARVESLFAQLNVQQAAAGEQATQAQLVAGVGDDEQFATAAALIARALGYESRVVVGVRMGGTDAGVPGVPACERDCTGQHFAAWIEVRGDGGAWVPFDVTPQVEIRPDRLEQGEQPPKFTTTPEERDAREIDPPIGLGEQGESSEDDTEVVDDGALGEVLRIIGLSLSALLLLALPLLFLPLAKRLRARRRRAEPNAELRALGAWDEMIDRARDAGVRVPANASRSEIAAVLATPPAAWAATQVDRAVFSPDSIEPEVADQLWSATWADRDERAATLGFWARRRAAYSLRSYGLGGDRRSGGVQG